MINDQPLNRCATPKTIQFQKVIFNYNSKCCWIENQAEILAIAMATTGTSIIKMLAKF
jgi:hypothetical protein